MLEKGTIGRYELIKKIGEGGMGVVWKAVDTRLGRAVALKLLPEDVAGDPQRLARFEREARMAAALNHPNIVTLHSIEEDDDGSPFLTMELVDGETLKSILASGGMSLKKFFEVAVPLCEAVATAHEHDVVHRDIKPANVMISRLGRLKVLDFGLARAPEDRQPVEDDPTVTMTGEVVGTLAYMAPEQLRGLPADPRTDIFSLGIVFYEMTTGRHPFPSGSSAEVISAILRDKPRSAHLESADVPMALGVLIDRCLEKIPLRRFSHGGELLEALTAVQGGDGPPPAKNDEDTAAGRPAAGPDVDEPTLERPPNPASLLGAAEVQRLRRPVKDGGTPALERTLPASLLERPASPSMTSDRGLSLGTSTVPGTTTVPTTTAGHASIAVLPFNDLSPDHDQEYFCDGLADDITAALCRVPGLETAARTSTFSFKGQACDVREIGERLGVATVLEGSVRKAGDQLRVTVQLSDVSKGFSIWTERYDRRMDDVFALQDEISQAIVERLKLELLSDSRPAVQGTQVVAAYELYLKGRFEWYRRTETSLRRGIELFHQAIEADPSYALAYAGLADSFNMMAFYCFQPPKETFPQAREAAQRALDLDDRLAEAHVSLAYVHHYHDWSWDTAEAGFKRALELKPDYPLARQWYFNLLICVGRFKEAWAQVSQAKELDPLSAYSHSLMGWVRYYLRDYSLAIKLLREAHELDPTYAPAYVWRSWACIEKGLYDEAVDALRHAVAHGGRTVLTEAYLGYANARMGKEKFARGNLYRMGRYRYAPAYLMALVRLALGEKERAMKLLEAAFDERSHFMALLAADPRFSELHDEPRYQALIQRIGLPPESSSYPVVIDPVERS